MNLKPQKIKEIFFVFFKLGCIAFGGPAAHISMMENEVVTKRKWMTRQYFLDMVGATNLIPGPNSTQMTMHCGHVRGGWLGLWVGGLAFIVPAIFFTLILAIIYGEYGEIPAIAPFFFMALNQPLLVLFLVPVLNSVRKLLNLGF